MVCCFIMFLVPSVLGVPILLLLLFIYLFIFENMGGVRYKFIGHKCFINFFLGDHGPIKSPLFFVTLTEGKEIKP